MAPAGDDLQHWDVLPSPPMREELNLYHADLYRPPAIGTPDPITLVGQPDTGSRRFRTSARIIPTVLAMGIVGMGWADPHVVWMIVIGVVTASIVPALLVIDGRRRMWKQPRLEVNGEEFTVTDVEGVTHKVAWSDVERLHLASVNEEGTETVHLTWGSSGAGVVTTANVGNTLDLADVRTAIQTRLPPGLELQSGPRRAAELG